MQGKDSNSSVEDVALKKSNRNLQYLPDEHLPVIEIDNFPLLGKVVAARFIEWVQNNPGGVISLPTGRTPEHFIKWVKFFLDNWDAEDTKIDLQTMGLKDTVNPPDMKSLHFFQMDEFYPIDSSHANSFCSYVKNQYMRNFGLDPAKVRTMDTWTLGCEDSKNNVELFENGIDLSVIARAPINKLEEEQAHSLNAINQFCYEYEQQIRNLGGIGFFLGGIGPDGHVAFNCKGADHFSTTRLTKLNYSSAAAAAGDLGGIETATKKHVITIGLGTIKFKKDACIIVFAAGDAKAKIVAEAVHGPRHVLRPASAFYDAPGFRFYLTKSAASKLDARIFDSLCMSLSDVTLVDELSQDPYACEVEKVITNLSLKLNKRLGHLSAIDFKKDREATWLLELVHSIDSKGAESHIQFLVKSLEDKLRDKIEASLGTIDNSRFLHTAPHHDDIMLGYLPLVNSLVKEKSNEHTFTYCTSGFNAVTNPLMIHYLQRALEMLDTPSIAKMLAEGGFSPSTTGDKDVDDFLNAHACRNARAKDDAVSQRIIRCVAQNFNGTDCETCSEGWFKEKIHEAIQYYSSQYQGQKDMPAYQSLKGMLREFEADLLWGYHGFQSSKSVSHIRMGFYKGEMFTEDPQINRDVLPLLKLMRAKDPAVVSVALDPEGSGPDTHYKVLQAVAAACKLYSEEYSDAQNVQIWGYRNVWFRFHPSEANIMFPISLGEHAHLNDVFETCFISQKTASFPVPDYDGPFSHWAQMIQAEQYQQLVTLLGIEYFKGHDDPRMRAARGFLFIHQLTLSEFLARARALKYNAEG